MSTDSSWASLIYKISIFVDSDLNLAQVITPDLNLAQVITQINYGETPEFQKDFKKLLKKFKSLESDLELAKVATIEFYHIQKINNSSVFLIQGFCTEEIYVCKIKKFACKALKGRGSKSGIRVIYAFHCQSCKIDLSRYILRAKKKTKTAKE